MWIIIGFLSLVMVVILRIFNQRTPILIGYFGPTTETLERIGLFFILFGLLVLLNTKNFFSKIFLKTDYEIDFEKFKQDESYIIKISTFKIKRYNRDIIIQRSDRNLILSCIELFIVILALFYLIEPFFVLVLNNLNPNSALYKNSDVIIFILFTFYFLVVDYILLRMLIRFVKMLVHRYLITIDPVSKQITFKRYFIYPIRIFWSGIAELTVPLDNIESLQVMMGLYSTINLDINDFHRSQKHEYPALMISSDNWKGDEKLFKFISSKRLDNRIKILGDSNMDILYEIKHFLIDYVTREYQ